SRRVYRGAQRMLTSLTPRACFSRRTSRTFRIGALSAGIGPPLAWSQRGAGPRFDRRLRELQAGLNRVAGFNRNGGGRLPSESVAGLRRNQGPASAGLRSRQQEEAKALRAEIVDKLNKEVNAALAD